MTRTGQASSADLTESNAPPKPPTRLLAGGGFFFDEVDLPVSPPRSGRSGGLVGLPVVLTWRRSVQPCHAGD